jgi:hypothetical protein
MLPQNTTDPVALDGQGQRSRSGCPFVAAKADRVNWLQLQLVGNGVLKTATKLELVLHRQADHVSYRMQQNF